MCEAMSLRNGCFPEQTNKNAAWIGFPAKLHHIKTTIHRLMVDWLVECVQQITSEKNAGYCVTEGKDLLTKQRVPTVPQDIQRYYIKNDTFVLSNCVKSNAAY